MPQTLQEEHPPSAEPRIWLRQIAAPDYACLPTLRDDLRRFLALCALPEKTSDAFCLSLNEILSNLVKHPARLARLVRISLHIGRDIRRMDIADDSTPFASFDAICNTARSRLHATERLAESGYGLGCVLSQHTRVTYTPATAAADGLNHFVVEDMPDSATEPPPGNSKKPVIFLVDDDAAALKVHHRMLSSQYDVVPIADAVDALALLRAQKPDLIISDLHMPGTDGAALRRQISGLPDGDLVPFIFLSASAESLNDQGLLRLGIDDYLVKPVTTQSLQRVAARVLGRREQFARAVEGRFHRDLQKYLHPHLPAEAGPWKIAVMNRMADAGGGDFTLYYETAEGLMAVLADVMGHGIRAKFFAYAYAGYLRSLFRATSERSTAPDTAVFLQHLSDAVSDDDFLDGTLLTCQSFHIDRGGLLRVSSAGHPPPLLLTRAGSAEALPVRGPLPGMAAHEGYRQHHTQLTAGDKVIFATDGFFDVFGPPAENNAPAALLALLPPFAVTDAAQTAQSLWKSFEAAACQTAHGADDATLIVLQYGEA